MYGCTGKPSLLPMPLAQSEPVAHHVYPSTKAPVAEVLKTEVGGLRQRKDQGVTHTAGGIIARARIARSVAPSLPPVTGQVGIIARIARLTPAASGLSDGPNEGVV